jgi:hypothetical protein
LERTNRFIGPIGVPIRRKLKKTDFKNGFREFRIRVSWEALFLTMKASKVEIFG